MLVELKWHIFPIPHWYTNFFLNTIVDQWWILSNQVVNSNSELHSVVYRDGQSRISGEAKGGATGSDVTESHVTGSDPDLDWRHQTLPWPEVCSAHAQSVTVLFSYYSSCSKCTIAHDRHGYRMWRDPEGVLHNLSENNKVL